MARRRRKPDARRARRRLVVLCGLAAGFGLLSYALFIGYELRQAGASLEELAAWSAARAPAVPRPQSQAPIIAPAPVVEQTAALLATSEPQAPAIRYDRGGDPIDPTAPAFSANAEDGVHVPPAAAAVADEHLPAPPATRIPVRGNASGRSIGSQLETLLADDPEALTMAQELLAEPDPTQRAENLRMLRDTFGVE